MLKTADTCVYWVKKASSSVWLPVGKYNTMPTVPNLKLSKNITDNPFIVKRSSN